MDLGLDDPGFTADLGGAVGGLFRAVGQTAAGHADAVRGQQFLGLVFVDIHLKSLPI